jgi:uncharacterized protein (DUF983 family)
MRLTESAVARYDGDRRALESALATQTPLEADFMTEAPHQPNSTPSDGGNRLDLQAVFHGLCPECGRGAIFASRWKMNPSCPTCGHVFERGPGYFTGAMYFSYGMGIPIIAATILFLKYVVRSTWPLHYLLLVAWVGFLPLVPWVWRASRILFIHFDRYLDPEG